MPASALVLPSKDRGPPSSHFSSRLQAGSDVKHMGNLHPEPAFFPCKLSLSLGRSWEEKVWAGTQLAGSPEILGSVCLDLAPSRGL